MRLLLLLALAALAAPAQSPAPQRSIRLVLSSAEAAWNRGDINGFMQSYWQSPQTEFVGAAGITRGWATVRDHYLHNYPNRAAMGNLRFTGLEVTSLCPDAALVTGHFHLTRSAGAAQSGVFTLVFRRFSAGWRIINDHTTAATAPSAVPVKSPPSPRR
ncbi:MAG: YybH family protein [Terriglobales bacterium]